jgi:rubrerythrin
MGMEKMIDMVEEARKVEAAAEKEYKKILKKLKDPEYADLRNLYLRMTIDAVFHKHLMEALARAYYDSVELIKEYGGEGSEEGIALVPGVPTIVMPFGFGRIGARVPPEEILEEYLKNFPEEVVIPDGNGGLGKLLENHLKLETEMKELYERLSARAFHPVVRELVREIKRNEEQQEAILKKLKEKYKE